MNEIFMFGEVKDSASSTRKRPTPKQCRSCVNLNDSSVCVFHLIPCGSKEYKVTFPYGKCRQYCARCVEVKPNSAIMRKCSVCGGDEALFLECRCPQGQEWAQKPKTESMRLCGCCGKVYSFTMDTDNGCPKCGNGRKDGSKDGAK